MLPGTGKTYLAKRYPQEYIDTDVVFERRFGTKRAHEVQKIDRHSKLMAIRDMYKGKIVLTNDPALTDESYVPERHAYENMVKAKRPDLSDRPYMDWYDNQYRHGNPIVTGSEYPSEYVHRMIEEEKGN
jgi:hypothetical protein